MFPLIAMIASAALSDMQNNQARADAHRNEYADTLKKIDRTRAQQLGAQPYSFMADDMRSANHAIDKAANASRNNHIGSMLASYFLNSKSGADEGASASEPDGLSAAMDKSGLGAIPLGGRDEYNAFKATDTPTDRDAYDGLIGGGGGGGIGTNLQDPWDKDPWGDAGF